MGKEGPTPTRRKRRDRLVALQDGRCAYCGEPFDGHARPVGPGVASASLDEVFPRSGGGEARWNSVAACGDCNSRKGNRDPRGCELVVLDWVNALWARALGMTVPKLPAWGLVAKAKRRAAALGKDRRP